MSIEPLPAIEVTQNGIKFYLTIIKASQLDELKEANYLKVEKYQYEEEEGNYQRNEDPSRTKDLAEFLIL